jgi:hypothetical protein
MLVLPSLASARRHYWYVTSAGGQTTINGSPAPSVGAGYLRGHAATHGGTGPHPWDLSAGDYCDDYKFGVGTPEPPFAIADGNDIGALTGFTPPAPLSSYQLASNFAPAASACQADRDTWGQLLDSSDPGSACYNWCGVNHSVSFAGIGTVRPWYRARFGRTAEFVLAGTEQIHTYSFNTSNNAAWDYMCALFEDVSTTQRLEYCLDEWNTWGAPPEFVSPMLYDRDTNPPQAYANIIGTFAPRLRFVTDLAGSRTHIGLDSLGHTYRFEAAVTRSNLVTAMRAINGEIRGQSGGGCPSKGGVKCYSTNADEYQLIGLENGREMTTAPGSVTTMGGWDRGLAAWTAYQPPPRRGSLR